MTFECMNNSFGEYDTEKGIINSLHNFQNSVNDKSIYFLNCQINSQFPLKSPYSIISLSVENNCLVSSILNSSNSNLESQIKSNSLTFLKENNFIKNAYLCSENYFISLCNQNSLRITPVKKQNNDFMDEMEQMFN